MAICTVTRKELTSESNISCFGHSKHYMATHALLQYAIRNTQYAIRNTQYAFGHRLSWHFMRAIYLRQFCQLLYLARDLAQKSSPASKGHLEAKEKWLFELLWGMNLKRNKDHAKTQRSKDTKDFVSVFASHSAPKSVSVAL